jgi:hypothetical protein
MYGPDQSGIHHHAHFVDDLAATVAAFRAVGCEVAMSAQATATEFCFIDTLATLGHFIELYEPSERLRGFYRMVADAAVGWDGSNPVRILSSTK